ncbi:lipid kinase YegS [Klebsiella michiganensis]|nr:lipid kinase YegS [Klebsiella michiganensis]
MSTFPASLLILNGKGANEPSLREAVKLLRDEGIDIHVRVTWEKGDAVRFIDEALTLNVETVIAGGGDGTINEVATALVEREGNLALGILPLGTANDFATSVGIPQDLVQRPEAGTIVDRDVAIDVARVNDKTGFINMTTGGFGTRITTETPEKLKAALGGVSYLIHGLMRMDTLKPDRCEIRGENFHWHGDALVIGIGNGRQAGGVPAAVPGSVNQRRPAASAHFHRRRANPRAVQHPGTNPETSPNIIDGVSSWFEITAPHEMTFNLDGEPLTGKTFRMELLPIALRCRLPPDCPLLR